MGMWKCRSIRFVDGEESMTGFEVAVDFLDAPGPKKKQPPKFRLQFLRIMQARVMHHHQGL